MKPENAAEILFLKRLGQKINNIRIEKDISTEEFQEKSGIERTQLWRIENGAISTSVLNLYRISQALGVPVSKLIG